MPELYDKVTPLTPLKAKSAIGNEDIMRYSRQLLLPELGVQGMDGYSDVHHSKPSDIYGMTEDNRSES